MSPRISNSSARRGVALVVTLIILSVILVVTFALLAISRRERSSVTTNQQLADAEYMASAGLERAKAVIAAQILGRTNMAAGGLGGPSLYDQKNGTKFLLNTAIERRVGGDLLVSTSTNSTDPNVFTPSYLTTLQYDARPPVFVQTNTATSADFRFFLDLNRNGRFESNGFFRTFDDAGQPIGTNTYFHAGDPEWVGILAQPGLPHSASNRFIGRYAFLVAPAGRTLDINSIHNNARNSDMATQEGYGRNQGYGSYEINLASFLTDLNTNIWGNLQYKFDLNAPWGNGTGIDPGSGRGQSFDDARAILRYRYNGDHKNLQPLANWLVEPWRYSRALDVFRGDYIDNFADDFGNQILSSTTGFRSENDLLTADQRWPGVDNPNRLVSIHDFFKRTLAISNSIPGYYGFATRLLSAGTNAGNYNRYTFYRLLSQIGTDTSSGEDTRINLNLKDTEGVATTDFTRWTPVEFFTNVARALLSQKFANVALDSYYPPNGNLGYRVDPVRGLTSLALSAGTNPVPINLLARFVPSFTPSNDYVLYIPIYPTNYYNAAVHQSLQLAANLYEASTNRLAGKKSAASPFHAAYLPTVYRPQFLRKANGEVAIIGYVENVGNELFTNPWRSLEDLSTGKVNVDDNVYGVPPIVAARKGFPALNEIMMNTTVGVARKILVSKTSPTDNLRKVAGVTNELFMMSVSNIFGIELINPYTNRYPRALRIQISGTVSETLTDAGKVIATNIVQYSTITNLAANTWIGSFENTNGLFIPVLTNISFLNARAYDSEGKRFVSITNPVYRLGQPFISPNIALRTTNQLRYTLFDTEENRVVDVVTMNRLETFTDISKALAQTKSALAIAGETERVDLWDPKRLGNSTDKTVPTVGVVNQLRASTLMGAINGSEWRNYAQLDTPRAEIENFRRFLEGVVAPDSTNSVLQKQAPLTAIKAFFQNASWQANDPFVHYLPDQMLVHFNAGNAGDYYTNYDAQIYDLRTYDSPTLTPATKWNLGALNQGIDRWGNPPGQTEEFFDLSVKDPLVRTPDSWNFPTNPYPNIGWIGRVHRGTPWQSVYLKAAIAPNNKWQDHVGADIGRVWVNHLGLFEGSFLTHPTNDWALADLFTVAPGEVANSGRIGVNQNGLAAWSAVLGGVTVLTNLETKGTAAKLLMLSNQPPALTNLVIQPANGDTNSPLVRIVNGINRTRAGMTNGLFGGAGDLLRVPELTTSSPYLNQNPAVVNYGISEEAYERIPSQILSLVRNDDSRYVIYAFGQALRPASDSLIKNPTSPFYNLCTNYQVMAEVATKSVIRFENLRAFGNPGIRNRAPMELRPAVESFIQLPPE